MREDKVYQLVSGIVGFGGELIQRVQGVLLDTHGNDTVAIFAPLLDNQWFIIHLLHLAICI